MLHKCTSLSLYLSACLSKYLKDLKTWIKEKDQHFRKHIQKILIEKLCVEEKRVNYVEEYLREK